MRKRYPDHDPRSWGVPIPSTVKPREVRMPGQWIECSDGRWQWDERAPSRDDTPTRIRNLPVPPSHELGTPRQEPAMSTLEPSSSSEALVSPGHDPYAVFSETPEPQDTDPTAAETGFDDRLTACPTCGTGVHPDRLRGTSGPSQWTGVQRDPDSLPIGGEAGDG